MAVTGNSLSERITRWDVLVTNLKDGTVDLSHSAGDIKTLGDSLLAARALESEKEDLRSQLRKVNSSLRELARSSDILRTKLGASLRGQLGLTDETLIKFGFNPRKTVRRKAKAQGETPSPTPSPAEARPG